MKEFLTKEEFWNEIKREDILIIIDLPDDVSNVLILSKLAETIKKIIDFAKAKLFITTVRIIGVKNLDKAISILDIEKSGGLLEIVLTNKEKSKDVLLDLDEMIKICDAKSIEDCYIPAPHIFRLIYYTKQKMPLKSFRLRYEYYSSFNEIKWIFDKMDNLIEYYSEVVQWYSILRIEYSVEEHFRITFENELFNYDFQIGIQLRDYPNFSFEYFKLFINLLTNKANENDVKLLKLIELVDKKNEKETQISFEKSGDNSLKLSAIKKISGFLRPRHLIKSADIMYFSLLLNLLKITKIDYDMIFELLKKLPEYLKCEAET